LERGGWGRMLRLTISDITTIYKCCFKSPEDKIYLGKPTDIRYNWSGKAEEM
jgi:hypothetical protein